MKKSFLKILIVSGVMMSTMSLIAQSSGSAGTGSSSTAPRNQNSPGTFHPDGSSSDQPNPGKTNSNTGAKGTKGSSGATGSKGSMGGSGTKGSSGPSGSRGATGPSSGSGYSPR